MLNTNVNETKKFYTTRMSSAVTRQYEFDREGYLITPKNEPSQYHSKRVFNPDKDKKIFVKGRGWVKYTAKQIQEVSVPKIETYAQIMELANKYGYRAASEMIGFQLSSYGDRYPISDVAKFETFGQPYLDWLERIAEIDYKIMQYFKNELDVVVGGSANYDMWLNQNEDNKDKFKCSFRTNPFLGFHVQTCLFGMIPMTPNIDPISWDESLWKVILEFHPDYTYDIDEPLQINELHKKYDKVSCKGWIEIMCGKDDAEWVHKNLTLKAEPINLNKGVAA
jgi:hypothetical protein